MTSKEKLKCSAKMTLFNATNLRDKNHWMHCTERPTPANVISYTIIQPRWFGHQPDKLALLLTKNNDKPHSMFNARDSNISFQPSVEVLINICKRRIQNILLLCCFRLKVNELVSLNTLIHRQ